MEAVARIAADHPQIAEIDVNPLLIRGAEPVAAASQAIAMGSTAFWAVVVAWGAIKAFQSEGFLFGRSG